MSAPYRGEDLALLLPTKDRPDSMKRLLATLAAQTVRCGQVIVIDGGESIEPLTREFAGRLPLKYLPCRPPGQIRQKNLGLANLNAGARLVGFLDDELELEPDALENMLACWNRVEADTAGVGFNIVNVPPRPLSALGGLFLMDSARPGVVLASGYNTRMDNVDQDARTQWLGGGYTVWRREVLQAHPQDDLRTRWAIGEDLRFSYPVGKKYPLYVCAAARVRDRPLQDQAPPSAVQRYRGRKGAVALFYFVCQHPELSRLACLWMLFGRCAGYLASGRLKAALGQAEGILLCLGSQIGLVDLRKALED